MNIKTFRIMLAKMCSDPEVQMGHWDVSQAFCYSPIDPRVELYVYPPEGHNDGKHVWRLHKTLYGLPDASFAWEKFLGEKLKLKGFAPLRTDPATYYKREGSSWVIIPTHVDDLFPTTNSPKMVDELWDFLSSELIMKDLGPVSNALKTTIEYDKVGGVLKLSNTPFILDFIEKYNLQEVKLRDTPASSTPENELLPSDADDESDADKLKWKDFPFKSLVGSLWWPAHMSRPDIIVAVHEAAKYTTKPSRKLMVHILWIVGYLRKYLT